MKPPNPLSLISALFFLVLVAGLGFLIIGDFSQSRDVTVSIWYVEEIEDPYGSGNQVVQVTYKDLLGDKVIIFYKTDLSSGLTPTRYRLVFETRDKLWTKTRPWTLIDAYPVSDNSNLPWQIL